MVLRRVRGLTSGTIFLLGLSLAGCGDSKKKDDATNPGDDCATATTNDLCIGKGTIAKAAAGATTIDVDLSGATEGEFVLMPYVLGDPAAVTGAGAGKISFKVAAAAGGSGLTEITGMPMALTGDAFAAAVPSMTASGHDHSLRTLLNRFDPALGLNQGDWFWKLARSLDAYERQSGAGDATVEATYREAALAGPSRTPRTRRASMGLTAAGACPSGTITAPDPAKPASPTDLSIPATGFVDATDFCLVFGTDPVTEPDKAKIQATVKAVLDTYKTLIYGDTFAAVGSYKFVPIIAVLDFDQASTLKQWPTDDAHQISGGFIATMSNDANQPMLYMAADFQKLKVNKGASNYDPAENKRLWHSTIAHELNHAVMDYYRARAHTAATDKAVGETPAVDEGLAHYMEDLFGCGSENFSKFQLKYLQNWANDLPTPVITATEDSELGRGATHDFIYYLISQKGGVTFTDGKVSGGDGLKFIKTLVTGFTAQGGASLAAAMGGDWTTTVGQFFGAMVLDGTTVENVDKPFKAQDPVTTLTDLSGATSKTYGMHFNGFGGQPAMATYAGDKKELPAVTQVVPDGAAGGAAEATLDFYSTYYLHYKVPAGGKGSKFTFTASEAAANMAVSVVRIK